MSVTQRHAEELLQGARELGIELSAQQLSEVEKGRKIQISLDAYRSAGGRAKVRP